MWCCDGCLRLNRSDCEALKEPIENCWAKESNKEKYLKGQKEILEYNLKYGNEKGMQMARKSIRRIEGARP